MWLTSGGLVPDQESAQHKGGRSLLMEQQVNNARGAVTRFTGGGFAIK